MKFYSILKMPLLCSAAFIIASCSSEGDDPASPLNEKETALQAVNERFVDATVIPIYSSLADKSISLQDAMANLLNAPSDARVAEACTLWKESRQYWEWSEAFLFGAASKYYIDPHIDTWPLDVTALNRLLNSKDMMDDIENVVGNLNYGLVGFHAIEYIIFRDGSNRPAADISTDELRYALAVAQDLALSCCRLEAAWAGLDNISATKRSIIEDAEMEPEDNFGEQMRLCGQAGSTWKSITLGSDQILEGCKDIVDEVGNSKIGKPHTGEDESYIESPHAYNSIQDFIDNIESVRYAYFGGFGATSAHKNSVSAYIRSIDPAADEAVIKAIDDCISAIDAMPRPFVKNYKATEVTAAMNACDALNEALTAAQKTLYK
ncbi:MAG: imelysin family protein [Muribaculaceae bacterium]